MANVNKGPVNSTGNVAKGPVNSTRNVAHSTGDLSDGPVNTGAGAEYGDPGSASAAPVDEVAPTPTPETVPQKRKTQRERKQEYIKKHGLESVNPEVDTK